MLFYIEVFRAIDLLGLFQLGFLGYDDNWCSSGKFSICMGFCFSLCLFMNELI